MAAFVGLLADWVPKILEKLPSIVAGGTELYNKFRTFRSPSNEKKAVDEAMELIRQHQGDIDKLMEDRKQTMVMLQGLSIMMERLTQHYGSPGIHHLHSPHNVSTTLYAIVELIHNTVGQANPPKDFTTRLAAVMQYATKCFECQDRNLQELGKDYCIQWRI